MQNPFDTDERRAFRETVERFVTERIAPHADAWDEAGAIPVELHERVAALGVFGFGIDSAYGGLGFDDAFMRVAFNRAMGRTGATGIAAQLGARTISTGPIHALGSHELKAALLPDIVAGRRGASLAITEPGGGSDVAGLTTRATRVADGYELNGSKTFITGAMYASVIVVAARTGGPGMSGLSLFAVDADSPGLTRVPLERKMGWWAADQATLHFDGCFVPAARLLGAENTGFGSVVDNFNLERLALVGQALGMMEVCLGEALAWAKQRVTFGRPLITRQAIRHKLAEMSARIDRTEAYLNQICWLIQNGPMPVAEICKAKFSATKALEFCASEAVQILGGAAYLRGQPVERVYREVKVMAIGGGSEEIMRDLAARQMGW